MSIVQMRNNFKIGNTVVLITNKYSKGPENPYINGSYGCTGIITHINGDGDEMSIVVEWENGNQNLYIKTDLKLYDTKSILYKSIW